MSGVRIAWVGLLLPLMAVGMGTQEPTDLIGPPLHRAWTVFTNELTKVHGLRDNVIFYTSQNAVGAIDSRSGAELWKKPIGGICHAATLASDRLLVLNNEVRDGEGHTTRLSSYTLADGERKEIGKFEGFAGNVIADSSKAYVLLPDCTILAINLKDNSHAWKSTFYKTDKPTDYANELTLAHGRLFVGMPEAGAFCLDPGSGTLIWSHHPEFGGGKPIISTKNGVVTTYDGVSLRDVKTGAAIWTFQSKYYEPRAICGNVLIGKDAGALTGIDLGTGKSLWKWDVKGDDVSMGGSEGLTPSTENAAILLDDALHLVGRDGKAKWRIESPFEGQVKYAGSDYLIVHDDLRIMRYEPGEAPVLPTDDAGMRTVAMKMVKEFALLDRTERQSLKLLGGFATQPLIAEFARWAVESKKSESVEDSRYDLYVLKEEALELLREMCSVSDTEALNNAIQNIGGGYDAVSLMQILAEKGDVQATIPQFLKLIEDKNGDRHAVDAALDAVARSSHPDAVVFMMKVLKDSSAPLEWRSLAFTNLAGTGGDVGVAAVREARRKRAPRPRWDSGFGESSKKYSVLRTARDSKGREWRIVESSPLGNFSDLFLQEKIGDKYDSPIFIGIFTSDTWNNNASTEYKGTPLQAFLNSEWINILPDDESVRMDTDKDGLTDIVEARLGTDPRSADTDGDQLTDDVDPCPNAAPRTLTDKEQIIAACIEARFFSWGDGGPAVIGVEGIKPFEFYGYGGTVIWTGEESNGSLSAMYGSGVNVISFHNASEEPVEDEAEDWVTISSDGRIAKTVISRYSGGLNGDGSEVTLRKIGDEWFVIGLTLRYVS